MYLVFPRKKLTATKSAAPPSMTFIADVSVVHSLKITYTRGMKSVSSDYLQFFQMEETRQTICLEG